MSVRCIARVLEESRHAGTELLMLVVLADYSDDDGNSYPAVASLARKCRMTSRNANYILSALQTSGELLVLKNEGPKGTNRYRIVLSALGRNSLLKPASSLKSLSPPQIIAPLKLASPLKPISSTPEAGFMQPLKPTSDEPSVNHQEPSYAAKLPLCPHLDLMDLYGKHLPELPQPRRELWSGKNAEAMRARWRWALTAEKEGGERYAKTAQEGIVFFDLFFGHVANSDFLSGRSGKWGGCDLGWLMKAENFAKVVQGNYDNKSEAVLARRQHA
jgi:hypothetical protein